MVRDCSNKLEFSLRKSFINIVGADIIRPVILEQNHIASAIISFGNPENENVFGRATKRRPYDVK